MPPLNGALTVHFTNGFAPAAGQVFDLVLADSITNSIASATVEGLQPGFQHQLRTTADGRLQLVLDMEIAGAAPGTLYDQVMVAGSATPVGYSWHWQADLRSAQKRLAWPPRIPVV